jgi:hypothetical protein
MRSLPAITLSVGIIGSVFLLLHTLDDDDDRFGSSLRDMISTL